MVRSALIASEEGEEEKASSYFSFALDLRKALCRIFDPSLIPDLKELALEIERARKGRKKSEFEKSKQSGKGTQ